MSDTTNIELARRILAAFDAGNERVVEEVIHPDHREHAGPRPVPGRDGVRGSIAWAQEMFSDPDTRIDDLIASGDRVVARVRFRATCRGRIGGIDASGRRFETDHVHIWRVADGRLAEHWMIRDDLSMLRQIGAGEAMA
jgi:predicted ester cyclase